MKPKKKYVLHPGEIQSKNDGEIHYISAMRLAMLYKVSMRDCYVQDLIEEKLWPRDLIHLYPNYEGDYRIIQPKEVKL